MDAIVTAAGIVSLLALLSVWTSKKSPGLPLPPGPPRIPFLGNALDIDITEPHATYARWGHQYGEIIYSRLLGQDYIIVNSEKVARTLSDTRRSAVYAGRPQLSIYKLLGLEYSTAMLPYGDAWRVHRKLFHQTLRSDAAVKYQPIYMSKAISLVQNLLQDGAAPNLETILQAFVATTVLSLTYGYNIESQDHPVVKLVQTLNNMLSKEGTPEKSALFETFPFVKYLPSWIPGLGFLGRLATCRRLTKEVWDQPFEYTKGEVAAGTAPQSVVADFLTSNQEDKGNQPCQELEATMKAAAATVYLAGAETSSSVLHTFILAMILFPEVQEKARAEIDSVVGEDRLPTFGDRDSLPYIEAIICETMRWHPPVPLGIPHATTTDDVYQGFRIPKGVIIIFNEWAMSRDCVNPDHFDPGRHLLPTGELSPNARMSGSSSFGFGRRVCPGRFFAEGVLWAAFVQILATLRFSKATDASGHPVEINPVFTNGVTSQPAPFQLSITGTARAQLIDKYESL
ncbi:cytochrome P450 [Rhizopogon vinicolor AM-OR11-026]|uniref:Cytochrome P450 n=1 Tax=Rhizopogon vinicolor AM-OR11-026 TaxID=1314800 RepID=A0A1B7MIM7_9AGAM|nr:cytochrome P450 [Rhizopogon vinicolor AM-OR11-026]